MNIDFNVMLVYNANMPKFKTTRSQIIKSIKDYFLQNGVAPSGNDFYKKNGFPCGIMTVSRLFGSWKKAVSVAGLEVRSHRNNPEPTECNQCGKSFYKRVSQKSRTKLHFCSQSCAATYSNSHKTKGYRSSKLEKWILGKIKENHPDLTVLPNDHLAIGSELDLYFPDLKLAIELNGIFHYEPVYGDKKLQQTQSNDQRKFSACAESGIGLCVIDVSSLKNFSERRAMTYLLIIEDILNKVIRGESES